MRSTLYYFNILSIYSKYNPVFFINSNAPITRKITALDNFTENTFGVGSGDGSYFQASISGNKTYQTGEKIEDEFNLTWEWEYHQNGATGAELDWCNACDTILGYIAAGKNVVKAPAAAADDLTVNTCNNNLMTSTDVFDALSGNTLDYNLKPMFDLAITINQVD